MKQRVPVEEFRLTAHSADDAARVLGEFITERPLIKLGRIKPEEVDRCFSMAGVVRLQCNRRAMLTVDRMNAQGVLVPATWGDEPVDIIITRVPAPAGSPKDRTPST